MRTSSKDRFSILVLGAAACVACCAGPILAFLGGLGIAGIASVRLIGSVGLVIAAASAAGFVLVRRRRPQASCTVPADEPVPVELTSRTRAR